MVFPSQHEKPLCRAEISSSEEPEQSCDVEMYSEKFYNYDIESNFCTAPCYIQNKTCTTWLVVDIGKWVVSNARLVSRCPKKGYGRIFDALSENQLLSFSTGCGSFPNFLIFCACRLHKMPLHQLSNSYRFPCVF